MTKNKTNPKVDAFLGEAVQWREEMKNLRRILLDCPLDEEIKWGKPCYTFQNNNIVLIHAFKEYCALLFFKGALLKDARGILVRQTENVQAARQVRFTSVPEIRRLESLLKSYVRQAIDVEKAGLEVKYKKTSEFTIPGELQNRFAEVPALKAAFEKLTPGRQRAYLLYFSAPKQSNTRQSRIEKSSQKILTGKGLDD